MFKQASKLRREAAKEIVHIKLLEDGYKKTISSLRQLADELMHPTRSVRPKNFDLVVERVRESEKFFYGDEYVKRIEKIKTSQRRRYDVDPTSE